MKKPLLISLITMLAWVPVVLPSVAATKNYQSSNWIAACKTVGAKKERLCQMSLAVKQVQGRKPLLVTSIQRDLKKKGYMLVLRLPHGLNLPVGVQLQIDKQKARRLAVLSSDRGGTFTRVTLAPKVLVALQKGNVLKVSFISINGKRFEIPVSLAGFSAAFSKFTALR